MIFFLNSIFNFLSSSSSRPTRSRRGEDNDNSDSDDDLSGEAKNDGNNSDSSVEVVKSWNTRSRAKESGLSGKMFHCFVNFYILCETRALFRPEAVNRLLNKSKCFMCE